MIHTSAADPFEDDPLDGVDAPPVPVAPTGPDQTDRVIIAAAEEAGIGCPCDVLVVDDATGELTAFALRALADHPEATVLSWATSRALAVRLRERFADALAAGRLQVPAGPSPMPLEAAATGIEPHLVLMRLPKAVHALEDRVRRLAAASQGEGRDHLEVIAGGRVKHMTRRQNEVLGEVFGEVRASRGIGKSRALIGSGVRAGVTMPMPTEGSARISVRGTAHELPLRGNGAVFGAATADAGSLLLLDALDRALGGGELDGVGEPGGSARAIDLGSGNGLMTAYLAVALPDASVLGTDLDADAVASTASTLAAAGLDRAGVEVSWDDAASLQEDASADLMLLNPPFHDGTAVDATLVQGLLDAAARVLRPGGQLWFVHNSHLRYRPELGARFATVEQRARDRRFTVLSAVR
ncbi:16S rRNA methyltransferase [Brachybacterium ginsengisoli]|uniref:16S rRNA methyltransferase n=1 Tax=Brachybacterium ginsengisoli TaxID=1331682 RepID=A0A291GVG2_9MICO|nr:methyltransferase [Brachybacterium ginsengisoli]ATG54177.1 16S rRNA methyltransferase [Brachybacterium ginsengisoli]